MASKTAVSTEVVVAGRKKLTLTFSETTSSEQAQKAVEACCVALIGEARKISYLRTVLGRLLAEVQQRKLFRPEFSSFEAYIKSLDEKHGLSRTVAREAMQIVGAFPDLAPNDAEHIPYSNLLLAAKAAKKMDTPREVRGLLKQAPNLSLAEYRETLVEKNLLGQRGRPQGYRKIKGVLGKKSGPAALRIIVTARLARQFKEQAQERFAGDLGKYLTHLIALDHGATETAEAAVMEERVASRRAAA